MTDEILVTRQGTLAEVLLTTARQMQDAVRLRLREKIDPAIERNQRRASVQSRLPRLLIPIAPSCAKRRRPFERSATSRRRWRGWIGISSPVERDALGYFGEMRLLRGQSLA